MAGMATRRVAIVPHTHWDREWYQSYQAFRLKLVDLLDTLLDLLESDDGYPYFMLDGQMAVVDDYLEVRPENEERLRALATAGRIGMGPWYILMDEFLASGETMIRNLQMGLRRAAAFGGAIDVGYLPDMFGHIAQMPQILRSAGFAHAVVWRGVPSDGYRLGFSWRHPTAPPSGPSTFPTGYSNGATLPDDAKALVERLEGHLEEVGELVRQPAVHERIRPSLSPALVGSGRRRGQPDPGRPRPPGHLPSRVPGHGTDRVSRLEGRASSGFRADMLMGVTSNRVDVKRLGESAVRELERRAEPLAALFQEPLEWPRRQLELAWKEIVRNSAHDSICACSVDDVVDAVLHRYAEARTIATGLARRATRSLARSLAQPGSYVLNPAHRARLGLVELVVDAVEPPTADVQVLSEHTGNPVERYSTPTPSVPSSGCCRARRSITTRGCTTS